MVLLPLKLAIFWSNQNHSRPGDQDGFSLEESGWKNKWKSKQNVSRCAAHIGMGGVKIKKEPRQRDEYVYRIS